MKPTELTQILVDIYKSIPTASNHYKRQVKLQLDELKPIIEKQRASIKKTMMQLVDKINSHIPSKEEFTENLKSGFTSFAKSASANAQATVKQVTPEIGLVIDAMKASKAGMEGLYRFLKPKDKKDESSENDVEQTSTLDSIFHLLQDKFNNEKKENKKEKIRSKLNPLRDDGITVERGNVKEKKGFNLPSFKLPELPSIGGLGNAIRGIGALVEGLTAIAPEALAVAALAYGAYKIISNMSDDLDNADKILGKAKGDISFTDKVAVAYGSIAGTVGSFVDSVAGVFGVKTDFEKTWKKRVAQTYSETFDSIKLFYSDMYDGILDIGKTASEWTTKTIDKTTDWFSSIGETITSAKEDTLKWFDDQSGKVKDWVGSVVDGTKGAIDAVTTSKPYKATSSFVGNAVDGVMNMGRSMRDNIAEMTGEKQDSVSGLIHWGESKQRGYNDYNRGSNAPKGSNTENIDLTNMTLGEINARQQLEVGDKNKLFAVGKYQMVGKNASDTIGTFKRGVDALGLDMNTKFTPEIQEKLFVEYLATKKKGRGNMEGYIKGTSDNLQSANQDVANEWASVAEKGTHGRYDGNGNNKAHISEDEMKASLTKSRAKYQDLIKTGMDETTAYGIALGAYTTPDKKIASSNQNDAIPESMKSMPVSTGSGTKALDKLGVKTFADLQSNGGQEFQCGTNDSDTINEYTNPSANVSGGNIDFKLAATGQAKINQLMGAKPSNLNETQPLQPIALKNKETFDNKQNSSTIINNTNVSNSSNVAQQSKSTCNGVRNPLTSKVFGTNLAYGQTIKNLM
jgi:hypothetical protein